MKIRFAMSPSGSGFSAEGFVEFVVELERLGFDTMWVSDVPLGETIDPIVALSYAAAATRKLKLGANVVPLGRNPMTLAKELAQIDRLSAGRVLLAFVPGVDQPGERAALGIDDGQRMVAFDESIDLCRRFWSGESVDHEGHRLAYRSIMVKPLPVQQPIEIWLGGRGAAALRRAGRLADGWLGAGVTPTEAPAALAQINAAATEAGRTIDPEHFGISLPYCHDEPPAALVESMATRYKGADVSELIPVGMAGLRRLVDRYLAAGVSKFVIRPVGGTGSPRQELARLADVLLPMQT